MKNNQAKNLLLFFALACCWGPSFLFMKIAVEYVPPITIATLRVAIGAIILYSILKFKKISLPKFGVAWKHFAVMGIFSCAIPFALFPISEQYIDSSFAAILNGTTPLFTMVIAHYVTSNDHFTRSKLIGSIIGFSGLLVLVAPSILGAKMTIFGIMVGIIASASYGVGFVYAKKYMSNFPPLVVPTAQLFLASLFLLPFSLIFESPLSLRIISLPAILSILGLAALGSALAFVLYYKLINRTSATYTSAVNYILPPFGIILGMVILDEKLTWTSYAGSLMILLGVMIINGIIHLPKKEIV